ncbi:MAG: type I-C CRISPR-associated protein Cas7/Csd2 [Myxococcales bacterium]|nr:type I-C CRISPR-associated protein Cas7/Csd2 [Myxococcales bacterium]
MTNQFHLDPNKRHDAVLFFDVSNGNPNGDPDAGNLPRVDPEDMHGIVTDVCQKRKIRNYIDAAQGTEPRYKIYVQEGAVLNERNARAYLDESLAISTFLEGKEGSYKTPKANRDAVDKARAWMCQNFYDVRMFGAVMSTGVNCGQVRGPMQLTFARSLDPITPLDISITRMAVTKEEEREKERTMGRKAIVPYGLYRSHLFFSPHLGEDTKVDSDDLRLFWDALVGMWDLDRSASRGMMACRGLFIFSHDHRLGNAPAHKLFERVVCSRKAEISTPRSFADYSLEVKAKDDLPQGVHLTVLGL